MRIESAQLQIALVLQSIDQLTGQLKMLKTMTVPNATEQGSGPMDQQELIDVSVDQAAKTCNALMLDVIVLSGRVDKYKRSFVQPVHVHPGTGQEII